MYSKIIAAMEECGEIVLSARDITGGIIKKEGDANYVTNYDIKVQEILIEELKKALPEAKYIAEEGMNSETSHTKLNEGYTFIIDPIDGTTNFIKGFDHSGISVALAYNAEIIYGAVYNPYTHQMYTAKRGCGAYINGKRITVHSGGLAEGIVSFGTTPYHRERTAETMYMVGEFMKIAMDTRRTGSAALDLCDVACQRSNLFFELELQPWDYAAGSLIITEAGGVVTTIENTALRFDRPCSILAGTPAAHKHALKIISDKNIL